MHAVLSGGANTLSFVDLLIRNKVDVNTVVRATVFIVSFSLSAFIHSNTGEGRSERSGLRDHERTG